MINYDHWITQVVRGGSSPNILGGGNIAPSTPSSPSPFSVFSETKKYELHIGYCILLSYLKSVISRVACEMG